MTLFIALLILGLHIFLCCRKHWAWGAIIPFGVLILMCISPIFFKDTSFGESFKIFFIPEILLLLAWVLCRNKNKKEGVHNYACFFLQFFSILFYAIIKNKPFWWRTEENPLF